jgi:hypothetical protein
MMMRRYALYCLSHLIAFLAGTALTYYSIAQEPERFNRFPIPLSEVLKFYTTDVVAFVGDPAKKNSQAGRSVWEYLCYRIGVDSSVIRFLNCTDHLFEREADRQWFAKFQKENKLCHINSVKLMLPKDCQVPNFYVREAQTANPEWAMHNRLLKQLPGLPPEVMMEEVRLRLYIAQIDAIFRLGRDTPGLGKTGDLIWLVREDRGQHREEYGPIFATSTSNFYFINARTGQMVALFPPLRPGVRVSHVLYAPEEMKPPKK